ncbi:hypothetical protein M9H77_17721 [Catharanthus roseus]|uniref:Uncharacterized protein n=1 Tax=Catharanthus roseus TaxID=4058 RepID=A0ACC0B5R9_CATRO|nr:hypothetical protein M9H77_17721 [Catharanthus roseus]
MIAHIIEDLKGKDGEFEAQEKQPKLFTISPTYHVDRSDLLSSCGVAKSSIEIRREVTNSNMSFRSEVFIFMVVPTISIEFIAITIMEIMHIP